MTLVPCWGPNTARKQFSALACDQRPSDSMWRIPALCLGCTSDRYKGGCLLGGNTQPQVGRDAGFRPRSATNLPCDFGLVSALLWAPVSLLVKRSPGPGYIRSIPGIHFHLRKELSSHALRLWGSFHPLTAAYTFTFYIKANRDAFVALPRSAKAAVLDAVGVMLMYFYAGRTHTGLCISLCLSLVSGQVQVGPLATPMHDPRFPLSLPRHTAPWGPGEHHKQKEDT